MNSAPYLLLEDRAEYEWILDDALRDAPQRPELAAVGQRLSAEQLRTMALNATALITSTAAAEYQHYVMLREELRASGAPYGSSSHVRRPSALASDPAPSAVPGSGTRPAATDSHAPAGLGHRFGAAVLGAGQPRGGRTSDGVAPRRWGRMSYGRRLLAALLGLRVRPEAPAGARTPRTSDQLSGVRIPAHLRTGRHEEPRLAAAEETTGAGVFAVFAVLVPVFSGAAAAIFLLIGLVLKVFGIGSAVAQTMITTGWLFGVVTVGAVFVCVAGLVVTAARSRGRPAREAADRDESEELRRARDAWRNAVLERGIMPFLREALADPATAYVRQDTDSSPIGRIPALGYNRPDFRNRGDDPGPAPPTRPRFSSPDFTSPDFGGPEHQSE